MSLAGSFLVRSLSFDRLTRLWDRQMVVERCSINPWRKVGLGTHDSYSIHSQSLTDPIKTFPAEIPITGNLDAVTLKRGNSRRNYDM